MKKNSIYMDLNDLNDLISERSSEGVDAEELAKLTARFEELLNTVGDDNGSISLQEHWALLHTARGENHLAIGRLLRALDYLKRLKSTGRPEPEWTAQRLSDLAKLYEKVGNSAKAAEARQQALAQSNSVSS